MTVHLRYAHTAGAVWNVWRWLGDGEILICLTSPVGPPKKLTFKVCSETNPVVGALFISRRTEGWLLTPVSFKSNGFGKRELDYFYLLEGASDLINDELSRL